MTTQTLQSRVEIFAAAIVEGKTQADAYRLAYPVTVRWSNQKVAEKASTFAKRKEVRARIAELRKKAMDANQVTAERVIAELAKLAFFDIRKLYDEKGNLIPVHQLDDQTAAAIQGLDVVTTGNAMIGVGEVLKVKIAEKRGSLELLARHLGLLNDKLKIGEDAENPLTGLMAFLQAGAGRIRPGGAS